MATSIRGLTVEISADASKFNKEMNALRKDAKSTQSELNALQKSLELKFDPSKFVQAQKQAQEMIDLTAEKADFLRQRLEYLEESGNIDTSHYRKLQSELAQAELEAQQLQKQLEKINNIKIDNLSKSVGEVGNKLSSVGKALTPISAAAAGVLTGFSALGLKAASTGAEIDDLSLRFGVSAEKLQEWQYLAVQTGVDVEIFNKALVKARSSMLDLATGTENNATKALQSLGLSMNQFGSQEEMFDGVINALASMEDKTLQAAYANEIFGDKIATQMLPFLNTGAEDINKFKEEFASIGALSNEQVSALASLDDTLYLLKESFKNIALQIGTSFAPLIKQIADILQTTLIPKLQSVCEWFNNLSLGQQEMVAKALLIVAALAPVVAIISKITSGIGSLIPMLSKLGTSLSALAAHPIILIIAAVAAVLVLLYTKCEQFRESINNLVSTLMTALQPVMEIIMQLMSSLIEMLTPIISMLGNILAIVINLVVAALQPVFDLINMLFTLLQPLLKIVLIPLQLALKSFEIPLKIIGQLLQWLTPLFNLFAKIIKGAFDIVLKVINVVLGAVEKAVNFVIDMINGLIETYNTLLGWLFGKAGTIGHVSLQLNSNIDDSTLDDLNVDSPDNTYEQIDTGNTTGDIYNYDYSQNSKTQNVTVTIQNFAEEVDVDDLVAQINKKLAEAM